MRERLIELLEDGLEESELQTNPEGECLGTDIEKFADYLLEIVLPYVLNEIGVSVGYLQDWYQNSIDNTIPPIWTDEHLKELCNDFIVIPKEEAEKELKRRMNND